MSHLHVIDLFKRLFPTEANNLDTWYPNGPSCILLVFDDRSELLFTAYTPDNWRLETDTRSVREEAWAV